MIAVPSLRLPFPCQSARWFPSLAPPSLVACLCLTFRRCVWPVCACSSFCLALWSSAPRRAPRSRVLLAPASYAPFSYLRLCLVPSLHVALSFLHRLARRCVRSRQACPNFLTLDCVSFGRCVWATIMLSLALSFVAPRSSVVSLPSSRPVFHAPASPRAHLMLPLCAIAWSSRHNPLPIWSASPSGFRATAARSYPCHDTKRFFPCCYLYLLLYLIVIGLLLDDTSTRMFDLNIKIRRLG